MFKSLYNQNGFIGGLLLSMVAVIIALIATSSFTILTQMDSNEVHYLQDKLQEELFLRSENNRIQFFVENNILSFQDRLIKMNDKGRNTIYKIQTKYDKQTVYEMYDVPLEEAYVFKVKITATQDKFFSNYTAYSPVVRYMEKISSRQSISKYAYFSDNEASDLYKDGPQARVKFWGLDELWGPVHSNTDIWIQEGNGSGSPVNPQAPGWPLFHGLVTTAGKLMNFGSQAPIIGSSAPVNLIFQGPEPRYIEGPTQGEIRFEPKATDVRNNGIKPYGVSSQGYEHKIFRCLINGNTVSVSILDFTNTRTDTFVVYNRYPDRNYSVQIGNDDSYIGDSLWTNTITFRDTVWNPPVNYLVSNRSIFLPGKTWVEGSVRGKMTIGTGDDCYTTGNITYENTTIGTLPMNENHYNRTDYFGLVSEGKIIVKYKYREPNGNNWITHANNSQGPNGHVYLYGAYAAIGEESAGPFGYLTAGTLTYEYQHPHGAVMPFRGKSQKTGRDTLYKFIDFHRHRFPPAPVTVGGRPKWHYWPNDYPNAGNFPGPYSGYYEMTSTTNTYPKTQYTATVSTPQNGTGGVLYGVSDYPWYNPVWPEKDAGANPVNLATDITWERGTLHVYGSIAQRRRGFIHRSGRGTASDNPDTGIWDPNRYTNDGALKQPIYGPPHRSTGYEKDYQYDKRLAHVFPPDFPEVNEKFSSGSFTKYSNDNWSFKIPKKTF